MNKNACKFVFTTYEEHIPLTSPQSDSSTLKAEERHISGYSISTIQPSSNLNSAITISTDTSDTCVTFEIPTTSPSNFKNVIFAIGSSTNLNHHSISDTASIDYDSCSLTINKKDNSAIKIHAILMFLTFLILMPLSVTIARYYKPLWPKMWIKYHQFSAIMMFIFLIVAWLIMKLRDGGGNMKSPFMHKTLGLILIIISSIIMPTLGIIRPHKVEPTEEVEGVMVEKFKVKKVTPNSENIKEKKDYRKRKAWEGIHKVRSYRMGLCGLIYNLHLRVDNVNN